MRVPADRPARALQGGGNGSDWVVVWAPLLSLGSGGWWLAELLNLLWVAVSLQTLQQAICLAVLVKRVARLGHRLVTAGNCWLLWHPSSSCPPLSVWYGQMSRYAGGSSCSGDDQLVAEAQCVIK